MNRKEFGELVATLRQDMDWTQSELAEYADVNDAVISQIERGVKKHFEPELLFCLANVFQLTTLERREFFLAASGLDQKQIVRQPSAAIARKVRPRRDDETIDITLRRRPKARRLVEMEDRSADHRRGPDLCAVGPWPAQHAVYRLHVRPVGR